MRTVSARQPRDLSAPRPNADVAPLGQAAGGGLARRPDGALAKTAQRATPALDPPAKAPRDSGPRHTRRWGALLLAALLAAGAAWWVLRPPITATVSTGGCAHVPPFGIAAAPEFTGSVDGHVVFHHGAGSEGLAPVTSAGPYNYTTKAVFNEGPFKIIGDFTTGGTRYEFVGAWPYCP